MSKKAMFKYSADIKPTIFDVECEDLNKVCIRHPEGKLYLIEKAQMILITEKKGN